MYQAAARPSRPTVDTVRVVLVLGVPTGSPELLSRTAQLTDEFGRLIEHSVPGVQARKAVISAGPPAVTVRPTGLTIDRVGREVRIDGRRLRLTYREFELMCYLAGMPRRPVSRTELMREVWCDRAPGADVSFRTVDTHVRRLRAKLDRYASVLTTVRGRGYRFDPRPDVQYVAAGGTTRPA